jgi:hypothetical protein
MTAAAARTSRPWTWPSPASSRTCTTADCSTPPSWPSWAKWAAPPGPRGAAARAATTGPPSSSSWPAAASRGGNIVGATDKHAAFITDKLYKVESFARTIYTQLGIDPDHEFLTADGRPIKIVVEDAPLIKEALS